MTQPTLENCQKLYHYTTYKGLNGILNSQSLWATNYQFLNDSSEIIYFKQKLQVLIKDCIEEFSPEEVKNHPEFNLKSVLETNFINDTIYKALGNEFYLTSFCSHKEPYEEKNGLLSQWRGYGQGGGYAIVFDKEKIKKSIELEGKNFQYCHLDLNDVVYGDNDKKYETELGLCIEKIKSHIDKILEVRRKIAPILDNTVEEYTALIELASRLKHPGFREENEVRIIAYSPKGEAAELRPYKEHKYRVKNGFGIPYIELFGFEDNSLPIERIIVGPHQDKEVRAQVLQERLANTGIKVTYSETPFV